MNNKQRDFVAQFFIDISKTLLAVFIIGAFVPNSTISIYHVLFSVIISLLLFIGSMRILRGYTNG